MSNMDNIVKQVVKESVDNMLSQRAQSFDRGMAIQMQIKDAYAQLIGMIEQAKTLNPNDQELQDCVESCLMHLKRSRTDFKRRLGEKLLVL